MNQIAELQQNDLRAPGGDLMAQTEASNVDMWGIAKRRKWLLIFGLMVGLGLGYIYLLRATPIYESMARVLIETQRPMMPMLDGRYDVGYNTGESKHAIIITSPGTIVEAYAEQGLEELPTFKESDKPIETLSRRLLVEAVDEKGDILDVSFRSAFPDDTETVVTAILKKYEDFLKETYQSKQGETQKMFETARDQLNDELTSLRKQRSALRQQYPEFFVGTGSGDVSFAERHQLVHDQKKVELKQLIAEIQSRIDSVNEAIANGDPKGLDSILMGANQHGQDLAASMTIRRQEKYESLKIPLLMAKEELESQYGPGFPALESIERKLDELRKLFADINSETKQESNNKVEQVETYLEVLKNRENELQKELADIEAFVAEEESLVKEAVKIRAKDEELDGQIKNNDELFTMMVNQLRNVEVASSTDAEYNFEILGPPQQGVKVSPKAIKVLPIAAIFGTLFGFGIAYLVDSSDKAFRTPDEVSRVMALPIIGHIPLIDIAKVKTLPGSNINPVLITVHRPKSPQSESYRAVRTALYFNNRDATHQVIQVTSPMPGDGKSTLACNLAVTIAQSGKSVLLIDADFRRPTLHKVLGIEKQKLGLAAVVSGEGDPADLAVQLPEVPNLSFLPCGRRPENPSELLSSQRFADTLEMFREQYDFVFVDTPPVLAVSDPSAVAARVDGVLLTFRIHKRAKPLATRARDALFETGANIVGVVVNGVDQEAGGYYSQYRYGFSGYRYAYNYRYGYGYGQYGTYGSDQDEPAIAHEPEGDNEFVIPNSNKETEPAQDQ